MFTKKDLQNGDIVVCRNGSVRIVLGYRLIGADDGSYLIRYNDNLTECRFKALDIVKVYRGYVISLMNYKDGNLVYDREKEEAKEMTLEEVCKELGYNVKIVKGGNE